MPEIPDIDAGTIQRVSKIPDYEKKRQIRMFLICFIIFIILASGALFAAVVIKSTMLAMFVLLVLFFWVILTLVFIMRARKDLR